MPKLILSVFLPVITWLFGFFGKFFTKKIAGALIVGVAFAALTATFIAALNLVIIGLSVVMPSEITIAVGWFVPSNAQTCMSAATAARFARWTFDREREILAMKSSVSS